MVCRYTKALVVWKPAGFRPFVVLAHAIFFSERLQSQLDFLVLSAKGGDKRT
jgi:hypothetical protein